VIHHGQPVLIQGFMGARSYREYNRHMSCATTKGSEIVLFSFQVYPGTVIQRYFRCWFILPFRAILHGI